MKDREIACESYICEGSCKKRPKKKITFRKTCQTCKDYRPIKHGHPARPNIRKQKLEKMKKDPRNW